MEDISKSEKKRVAEALKKLGVSLMSFSAAELDRLPLSPPLRQAIDSAKAIKSHGALRRQHQLIGKLMRGSDPESIRDAVEQKQEEADAKTAHFHELEGWRDRLVLQEKEALTAFVREHPGVDTQQLRQLIKKAVEERASGKPIGAAKALFRYLRECS